MKPRQQSLFPPSCIPQMDSRAVHPLPGIPQVDQLAAHPPPGIPQVNESPLNALPRTIPRAPAAAYPAADAIEPPASHLRIVVVGIAHDAGGELLPLRNQPGVHRVLLAIMDKDAVGEIVVAYSFKVKDLTVLRMTCATVSRSVRIALLVKRKTFQP